MYGLSPTGGVNVRPPAGWPYGIGHINPRAWLGVGRHPGDMWNPAPRWRPHGHSYAWLLPTGPEWGWAQPGNHLPEILGNGVVRYPAHSAATREESIRVLAPLVLPHLRPPNTFKDWDEVARTAVHVRPFEPEVCPF